ncbi:MAG: hypothetical protein IKG21_08690 [Atopobiaceae bacterium]|nr:hypothetical protein [Atopobiaceae bacterium]
MSNRFRRCIATALAFALCFAGVPTGAMGEAWGQESSDISQGGAQAPSSGEASGEPEAADVPEVVYRTHVLGGAPWTSADEGWNTGLFADAVDEVDASEDAPIDVLEVKTTTGEDSVEYCLLDGGSTWQATWTSSGGTAAVETGVYGVKARLSEKLGAEYELWYRSRVVGGAWLGWAHAGEPSGSANAPIAQMQFALCALGDGPSAGEVSDSGDVLAAFEEADVERAPLESAYEEEGEQEDSADETEQLANAEAEATEAGEAGADEPEAVAASEAGGETGAKVEAAARVTTDATGKAKAVSRREPTASGTTGGVEAMAGNPTIEYRTHVQTYGWQGWVKNGAKAGTSGESKRLEAMRIRLKNASGSVVYQTHAQTYGWLDEVSDGELSGTSGESKRLEAIKISLRGAIANTHDVWYRCHVQTYGWQGWVKNGALAGTSGQSKRVEALQIRLVKKGDPAPSPQAATGVEYRTHVQTYGWQDWVANGSTAGTSGESKRLEAMCVRLQGVDGGVTYRTHVQTYGWQDWRSNGELAGTSGESKRLEAVQIKLTGDAASAYDVWYRCHVQRYGWMGWAKNGANAGSEGGGLRMEALQIKLLPKGNAAPGSTSDPYVVIRQSTLDGVDISGWQQGINIANTEGDFFIIKATEGVSSPGVSATRYNPWYRQWANEVLAEGRLLGFYHYANGGDAVQEADEFYETIKDYKGRAIACLDWEKDGNRLFESGMDVAWCKTFLDRLQSRFGGTPFLYTSKFFSFYYDWSSVAASYPLWGAETDGTGKPTFGYLDTPWQSTYTWGAWGTMPTIHQYSGMGVLTRNGGMRYFDLDKFYGNRSDWMRYAGA